MAAPGPVTELAKAKVNLALHILGRRPDGYHRLDSLVAFPSIADEIEVRPAPDGRIGLSVIGPFAAGLSGDAENLVHKATQALANLFSKDARPGADIALTKRLPIASGIGGGSADAAATLRALRRLWDWSPGAGDLHRIALSLGADVPMCLDQVPVRAEGIGDRLTPLPPLPAAGMLLVNPGVAVSTPSVFRALVSCDNAPVPALPDRFTDLDALVAFLDATRNDLEAPAMAVAPGIADVIGALKASQGCRFARMSGSGATCFGLFLDEAAAQVAAGEIVSARPGWWVAAGAI